MTVLTLAVTADYAGAEAFSVSNQSFRVTWSALTFEGGFGTVRCPVTFEGSFHSRTFAKVERSLIGFITRATTGTCASGGATVLTETLPWHVQYSSFTGTLPNITALNLLVIGASMNIREPTFGINCLGRTTAERPMTLSAAREAGGSITTAAAGGSVPTSCGVNGTLGGSGTVTLLGSSTTRIVLEALEARGELSITPNPINIIGIGNEEVTLRHVGIGRVRIDSIGVSAGGAIFSITDPNGCVGRTLSLLGVRECRFRVFSNAAGREGEVTIRYTRPGAEARTVRVRS